MGFIAGSISSPDASPSADLVIGIIAILLGGVLGLNIKGISTTLLQNGTGFTPWGRRRSGPLTPNPARVVGWGFVAVGLIALVVALVRAIK